MPWCPICKNEYKEGYEVCSDCGCTLVENLEDVMEPVYFSDEATMHGIEEFLRSNDINDFEIRYDDGSEQWELYAPERIRKDIITRINVYIREFLNTEDGDELAEDEAEEQISIAKPYETPESLATEYKSGAWSLILVGVAGIVLLVLMNLGKLPFLSIGSSKILLNIVMGFLFLVFIYSGISSYRTAARLKVKQKSDDEVRDRIMEWAEALAIDPSDVVTADKADDDDGAVYFARMDLLRKKLEEAFTDLDKDFEEYILEDVYSKVFDNED
ncbi:MAG: hypothetical protein K5662_08605 [Lachnospiraceae bacterium]|nr:hypothetical protein [Lachnospiraceae bacterium]